MKNFAAPEQYFAICIGINAHPTDSRVPALLHAEEDASTLYQFFQKQGIPAKLLCGKEATVAAIDKICEIYWRSQSNRDSAVIFYYAGYLIPFISYAKDKRMCIFNDVCLAAADLSNYLHESPQKLPGLRALREQYIDESQARHQLCLLDCYGAQLDQQIGEHSRWIIQRLEQLMHRSLPGRMALANYAASDDLDAVTGQQRFSAYLMQALKGDALDVRSVKERTLTVHNLYTYLEQQLQPLAQKPILSIPFDVLSIRHYQLPLPPSKATIRLPRIAIDPSSVQQHNEPISSKESALPTTEVSEPTIASTQPMSGDMSTDTAPEQFHVADEIGKTTVLETEPGSSVSIKEKLKVAVCYDSKGEKYAKEFRSLLVYYYKRKDAIIDYWDRSMIAYGTDRDKSTSSALRAANIVILLVSSAFMSSEYGKDDILRSLIEDVTQEKKRLIPIMISSAPLQHTPLEDIQFLDTGKPLSYMSVPDREALWARLIKDILNIAEITKQGSIS